MVEQDAFYRQRKRKLIRSRKQKIGDIRSKSEVIFVVIKDSFQALFRDLYRFLLFVVFLKAKYLK
jgi:hypothetical protein